MRTPAPSDGVVSTLFGSRPGTGPGAPIPLGAGALAAKDVITLTTKTQACASARALVGAAVTGSAMGLILLVVNATGFDRVPDQTTAQGPDSGLRGPVKLSEAEHPRLVRASLFPEPPAALPASPIPYIELVKPKPAAVQASDQDLECLTRAVYFESRGDSDVGQLAVAQVVLNRARHPAFPKSVCGVINQGRERGSCQFSFVCKPTKVNDQREWARARRVAEKALQGHEVEAVGTSTFFHAARINPGWGSLTKVGRFGNHIFYRYSGKRGAPSAFSREPKPSLLESIAGPIQAAFAKPAVETATAPPTPLLSLPGTSKTTMPPASEPQDPVTAESVATDAAAVVSTMVPVKPEAVAVEPTTPVLQPISGQPTTTASGSAVS